MSGNILNVVVSRVKPYVLIQRDKDKIDTDDKKCENEEENEEM